VHPAEAIAPSVTTVLLPVRRWGSGPRTAVLVHGYTDDSETWWRVAPQLAEHGWTVLAPDLRGHGAAARTDHYSLPAFANDLVESVPPGVELLLGHSLGALAVNLAAPALRPARTVLVDPPWGPLPADLDQTPATVTRDSVAGQQPLWCDQDVRVDVGSSLRLDPQVTAWISSDPLAGLTVPMPVPPSGPTTVMVPAEGALGPVADHAQLRAAGFELVQIPGVGHVIHRDDPVSWLAALLDETALVP
jgi:pimeloyl-ACP methyl ester carboxylesterase